MCFPGWRLTSGSAGGALTAVSLNEDRELSPYTGWTRQHWADLADHMLAALDPYRSPLGARVDLPGPASQSGPVSDGLVTTLLPPARAGECPRGAAQDA